MWSSKSYLIGRTTENPFFVLNETDTRVLLFVNREWSPRFVDAVPAAWRDVGSATEPNVIFIGFVKRKSVRVGNNEGRKGRRGGRTQ